MGLNCAIHIQGVAREEFQPFLEGLAQDGVIDDVRSISFTEEETICIIEYDGAEFLARYGAFPVAPVGGERLWVLFEFDGATGDQICDGEGFRQLARKLPPLEGLRSEIEAATEYETGGGLYGREGAYSPWGGDAGGPAE